MSVRCLVIIVLGGLAVLPPIRGAAHSWYPQRCCTEQDCVRVDRIERRPDGSLWVTAGHIGVAIPKGFPAEPSQDHDAHVCTYRNILGHHVPRCLFLPAES